MSPNQEWPLADTCTHHDLNLTPEEFERMKALWKAGAGIPTEWMKENNVGSIDATIVSANNEIRDLKIQRDGLLEAAKRLAARGWFKPHGCADKATLKDMEAMREAIDSAKAA